MESKDDGVVEVPLSPKRFHRKGFKGHIVAKPTKSDYRRDGLTNNQRVKMRIEQRKILARDI